MEHSVNGSDVRPYWGRGTWRPLSWRFEPSGLTISQTASDLLFSEMRLFWHQKESFLIQIVVRAKTLSFSVSIWLQLFSYSISYWIYNMSFYSHIYWLRLSCRKKKRDFKALFHGPLHIKVQGHGLLRLMICIWCVYLTFQCLYLKPAYRLSKKTATTLDPKLAVLPIIICWHIKSL